MPLKSSRKQGRRNRRKNYPLTFTLYMVIFGLLVAGGYFVRKYALENLVVRNIECRNQYSVCSQAVLKGVAEAIGKPYQESKTVVKDFLQNSPLIVSYFMQYRFPDKLVVDVIEEKALYALKSNIVDTYAKVQKDGKVIGFSTTNALPVVEIDSVTPDLYEKVGESILFAMKLVSELSQSYSVESAEMMDNGLVVEIEDYVVIFPLKGDIELVLGSFYTLYNQLNSEDLGLIIGERKVKEIDFRYKNPVIRTDE